MSPRIIHLRRPPVLHEQEGPFVSQQVSLADVDARWNVLTAKNPRLFDGPCWHVLGVSRNGHGGASLHVMRSSYRFHAVQTDEFDVGFRGLGVRAITFRDREVLLGRRGDWVMHYAGMWEFMPAGKLEPGADPVEMIQRELHEESGLRAESPPGAIAIVFDPIARSWQIVYRIDMDTGTEVRPSREHSDVRWSAPDNLPEDLSPVDRQLATLLRI